MATILVVEDDEAMMRMHKRLLGSRYLVLETDRAEKAEEIVYAEPLDLIILDNNLAGEMTGYQLLERFRQSQEERVRTLPIVMCCTPVDTKKQQRLPLERIESELGAYFLEKPFDLEDYRAVVEKALHAKSSTQG